MSETSAKVSKIRRWSPIWIVPIITAIIGITLMLSHIANLGHSVTLITNSADWITEGKTMIKSRNVNIGVVESVELSPEFDHVILRCMIDKKMGPLLREDSMFWVVSPQIDKSGITGLGTIISGTYIELKSGTGKAAEKNPSYRLLDDPPAMSLDTLGIVVVLNSSQTNILNVGTPVYFKGFTVGRVESADFDIDKQIMSYRIFVRSPYDRLLTSNVRFWRNSGIDFSMSASGVNVELPSLSALIEGGVSFGLPDGIPEGEPAARFDEYELFDSQSDIRDFRYTKFKEYLLFFDSSISGLAQGAPVEFRGIRLGTVTEAPYIPKHLKSIDDLTMHIPVLIRIEPERVVTDPDFDMNQVDKFLKSKSIRASLESQSLLTGTLFVDLDTYPNGATVAPEDDYGYATIPTMPARIELLQARVMETLDHIGPFFTEIEYAAQDLREILQKLNNEENLESLSELNADLQLTMAEVRKTLLSFQPGSSFDTELQATLEELRKTLQTFQPGSDFNTELQTTLSEVRKTLEGYQYGSELHSGMMNDVQQLDRVLKELLPVLKTLNDKSNSLVFEGKRPDDIQPMAK